MKGTWLFVFVFLDFKILLKHLGGSVNLVDSLDNPTVQRWAMAERCGWLVGGCLSDVLEQKALWSHPIPSTPPKFNMEPENHGFQKDFPFPGTYFQVPC